MLKTTRLTQAVALALLLPGLAAAEFEISGEAKLEHSVFTKDGQMTGAPEEHDALDGLKTEPSIKLFINSDVGEESSFHAEILFADDGEAVSDRLEGGEPYTQYEVLREFYFDVPAGGWDLRLGKQQVVWGTADGIKLLDIINPTDYRELNQNVSEDSRIPVWMVNAEMLLDNGGDIQLIASEARPNFIAGLDEDGDTGAPFIFKGVDTITGETGGFLNIAKDFGRTSGVFETLLTLGGAGGLQGALTTTTVGGFTALGGAGAPTFNDAIGQLIGPGGPIDPVSDDGALMQVIFAPLVNQYGTGNAVLDAAANDAGSGLLPGFTTYFQQLQTAFGAGVGIDFDGDSVEDITNAQIGQALNAAGNLIYQQVAAGLGFDPTDPASAGGVAAALGVNPPTVNPTDPDTIAFNNAVQQAGILGLQQTYFIDGTTNQFNGELDPSDPTDAFSHLDQTAFGTFTNFIGMTTEYRQDHPDGEGNLGARYRASTDGGTNYSLNFLYAYDPNPIVNLSWEDQQGNPLSVETATNGAGGTTVTLENANGSTFNPQTQGPANLVFEETLERSTYLGASFDTALDTDTVPVIIRGEFLYQMDANAPVVDRDKLAYGDLVGALQMEETDYFKYVLGVDVTVMTNLLISTQLIQFYNLDFVDEDDGCPANTDNCGRYTGDFSSMAVDNSLKKGDEVETFISLFLSKPFGSDVQHRWNNILIMENDGGYWNRFDVEYSFDDNLVGTVEYNKYWGDEDTTFGQFEDTSNLQLGIKYIF